MKHWLIGTLLLLAWVSAGAQVSGVVVDSENNKPISGVMVKAIVNGMTKAFATSDPKGVFNIPKAPLPCTLSFSHLSYESYKAEASNNQPTTYRLVPSNRQLEDVVIEAPRIVQRGDTTTYHLGRFVSKRDVTVQEALKKLPGVEVTKGGTISYLGKAIDKLTIDGMDLVERDYQSTIQNLRHEKVAKVEIMENQQEVKMLKDLVGDDKIVMNLVLNRKARGRANGKAEIGTGIDSHKEVAYRGMGHLLYVQPRWQTTMEGRLDKNFNATDEVQHSIIPQLKPNSPLLSALPKGLSVPTPSISPHFYLRQKGGQGKLKSIYQIASDRTIRADLSYSDYTSRHTYGNELTFLNPSSGDNLLLDENKVDIRSREQVVKGMLEYKRDGQKNYLKEAIDYVGVGQYQQDNILRAPHPITQVVEQRSHLVRNSLRWYTRRGDRVFSLNSDISYQTAPLLSLTVPELTQRFREQMAQASLSSSFLLSIGKGWQLSIPIEAQYTYDVISKDGLEFTRGNRLALTLSPRLWRFTQGENNLSLTIPTTLAVMKDGAKPSETRLLLSPSLYFMHRFNRTWSVFGNLSYNQNVGSLLDLLRTPYFTTYREELLGSGNLRNTRGVNGEFHFGFRAPIRELYGNISLTGRYDYSDHLFSDDPSERLNRIELVKGDNTSGSYGLNAYISRFLRKSKTKISLGLAVNYAHFQSIRQDTQQKSQILGASTWGSAQFTLNDKWSGEYNYSVDRSQMWYSGQTLAPLHGTTNKLEATYSPTDYIHLTLIGEHQGKELLPKEMKHLFLLSCVGEYRSHIGNFKLHLHNLLNMQEYGFTSYGATERNRSWYQLRGRSALLSYTFYY
ncbi:hypothetical protein IX308_001481 [Porphyromonas levii]|uniref:carboxypeptidase-like regulatory domain-containing protein n=1 Tax=Porphyromonas levii TaxID=28114 RepID=UPI001BADA825|nr:carboxypeptidase-like regulatory domain-containing protein [Porphyromonas levii]MBR8785283.1 hypothetical protein [Porphyromonas levii]